MIIRVTIAMSGQGGYDEVSFDLRCADGTQIVGGQIFEILEPGHKSVKATPISTATVHHADGITTSRMIGENRYHSFTTIVKRLRSMRSVSNVTVSHHPYSL